MPINVEKFEELLVQSRYPPAKINYLINGFKKGFDIGYRGPLRRKDLANNIPIRGVGSKFEMWPKLMKEVKLRRYAGPFSKIPFEYYMQSLISLVPKAGGQTRLIFHLSYDFGPEEHQKSLNYHTPTELSSVKYKDLDFALKCCLKVIQQQLTQTGNHTSEEPPHLYFSKSDLKSAFRLALILPEQQFLLMMKCSHPVTGKIFFFIEKCLPFGSSSSCKIFTEISEGLHHIVEQILGPNSAINYLDDYLFISYNKQVCNEMISSFLVVCHDLGFPVVEEKTEYATDLIVFLGVLLDGRSHSLAIPLEKWEKALKLLDWAIFKRKVTVHFIQKLTGTLNFLYKVIVPGRTFLRRMYDKLKIEDSEGNMLKQYHQVNLESSLVKDCKLW